VSIAASRNTKEPVDRIRDVDPVDTELAHRDGDLIAGVECLRDAPLSGVLR
jgi:hypothetical protein